MEQKGISVAAVVVISIIIAACVSAGVYFFLLKGEEGGVGALPKYPGSQSYDILEVGEILEESKAGGVGEMPEGAESVIYIDNDATIQEILNWYKGQMPGWTLRYEGIENYMARGTSVGCLLYGKGTEGAKIVAVSGIEGVEGTIYVLVAGPWSEVGEPVVGY
jgi:hypothetical protein